MDPLCNCHYVHRENQMYYYRLFLRQTSFPNLQITPGCIKVAFLPLKVAKYIYRDIGEA